MKKIIIISFTTIVLLLCVQNFCLAQNEFTQQDRELLIELKVTIQQMEKRFNERFAAIDNRFEQITNFMWILAVIFIGIVAVTIGFALWDRRTMIRPFETKVNFIEERLIKAEESKVTEFISAIRDYAKLQPELAKILKTNGLL